MSHAPSLRNPIACLMRYISNAKKALQTHTSGSMTDAIHRRNVTQSLWVSRKWSEPQRSARVMNNTHTSIPKKLEKLNQNELWTGLHFRRLRSGSSLEHKQLAFGFGSFCANCVPNQFPHISCNQEHLLAAGTGSWVPSTRCGAGGLLGAQDSSRQSFISKNMAMVVSKQWAEQ